MRSLYLSQQGCALTLSHESILVKQGDEVLDEVQLPLLEQVLIFGQSQITTQAVRACLWRNIPIVYLSRMGKCYGRTVPLERGYRQLARQQQAIAPADQLAVAQQMVRAKLRNSRVILLRQQRRQGAAAITTAIASLEYLADQASRADSVERLMGLEGAGASSYFSALGDCFRQPGFVFMARSRRPPGNPINAMLSFGYQILWNHLLTLIELQGLDAYQACLHQGSERHAALASDLVEEFRAPIVDSLTLYVVNRGMVNADRDFEFHDGGCFLNESGRKRFLQAFVQRMEESLSTEDGDQPRWDVLMQQVKAYKRWVYDPTRGYVPYQIR
jgi:CRISPR-associated protein Cas1